MGYKFERNAHFKNKKIIPKTSSFSLRFFDQNWYRLRKYLPYFIVKFQKC